MVNTETPGDAIGSVVKCPTCGDAMERIDRTVFMRALIGSKRYYCRFCHKKYLYFRRRFFPLRR
jgi:transposase-like protein